MARKTSETAFFGVFCISYPISGQTQSGHVLCKGLSSRTSALVKRRFQCHNRASTLLCWRINPEKISRKITEGQPQSWYGKITWHPYWKFLPFFFWNPARQLPPAFRRRSKALEGTRRTWRSGLRVMTCGDGRWRYLGKMVDVDLNSLPKLMTWPEKKWKSAPKPIGEGISDNIYLDVTIHNDTDTQGIFSKSRGCSGRWARILSMAMADPAHFGTFCSTHPRQGNVASWLV